MATKRRASSERSAGPPRRPALHWRLEPAAGPLPHELEADAVGVLVGLIEWADHVGLDFETLLARARATAAERRGTSSARRPPRRRPWTGDRRERRAGEHGVAGAGDPG